MTTNQTLAKQLLAYPSGTTKRLQKPINKPLKIDYYHGTAYNRLLND